MSWHKEINPSLQCTWPSNPDNTGRLPLPKVNFLHLLHSIQFIVLGSYNFDWGTHINYKYCCCWYLHNTVTLCTATIFYYTLCWLGPNMHERKKSCCKCCTLYHNLQKIYILTTTRVIETYQTASLMLFNPIKAAMTYGGP